MYIRSVDIAHTVFDISGLPIGERPIAPNPLAPHIPQTDDAPGFYLVADPTRIETINKVMDLDIHEDSLGAAPLWRDDPDEDGHGDAGPWLLDLRAPNKERVAFLRKYFATYAGHRCGLFVTTRAERAEPRQFLRGPMVSSGSASVRTRRSGCPCGSGTHWWHIIFRARPRRTPDVPRG